MVEDLIPHRDPFLFVDRIISASKEEIVGTKTFDKKNFWLKGSFPEFSFVPGTILIESMAQCGGAGIRSLGLSDGLFGLAGIDQAEFLKGVEYDQEITYKIKNLRIGDKIIKQSGIAYVNGEPVLTVTWMCLKLA
jgi:3-hydroxyacyl-[acyl-carrier-protein] dehydratase